MDKTKLYFSAINPVVDVNLPSAKETEIKGRDMVSWGENNRYCDFLYDLYSESPSVQTIVNGTSEFAVGNDVSTSVRTAREIEEIVNLCLTDYQIFGAYAMVIRRNKVGELYDCDWIDVKKLRTNEKNTVFFYSDDWSKSYGRVKTIVYPKFMKDSKEPVSILFVKNPQSRTVYPLCPWHSAIRSAKIETEISKFHLNEICNNFSASAIINMNNGVPEDEQKEEIEEMITEKFTGSENAGRFLISFNANKENETTIQRLDADGFDERYKNLEKSSKEQIFTAFRAIPALFGLMTESTGFNSQEFAESFKLYNRTKVKPLVKVFKNNWEKVWGTDTISFVPFSIETED